jgi:hypothetical protein
MLTDTVRVEINEHGQMNARTQRFKTKGTFIDMVVPIQ